MGLYQADLIIRAAIADYRPAQVFALFSGGHDSLTATHVAMRHPEVGGVIHVHTGTGVPETFDFVRETCARERWPLHVYRPPRDEETGVPGTQYRELVLRGGFPGPGAHRIPYVLLKERALDRVVREWKRKRTDRIMFLTGIRSQESQRRMGSAQMVRRDGAIVWVNPIIDWTADECGAYIEGAGLARNLVSDLLHISGECLCGAFARKGEMDELTAWYPRVAERIRALEAEASRAGVHARWGVREPGYYRLKRAGQMEMPLCWGCSERDEGVSA